MSYFRIFALAPLLLLGLGAPLIATDALAQSHALGTYIRAHQEGRTIEVIPLDPSEDREQLPAAFDWGYTARFDSTRNPFGRDIMGPTRAQGNCGSCWAFGTAGVLEAWINGIYDLPSSVDLSEEVLVSDCCGAGDCNGGYIDEAADFLVALGTTTEACWPYTASDGPCAGYCSSPTLAKTASWAYAANNWWTIDIPAMREALANHGPLVVAMDVYTDFNDYEGGVYQHQSGSYRGGHAIVLTGYVDSPEIPGGGYFIAKNSWGTDWGPYDGYFAIAYQSNCNFGIEATYFDGLEIYDLGSVDTTP